MWLALYIPALPLQAFSHTLTESAPVVVFEREARRSHIVARNQKAARLGVRLHATLAEANALSDALVALPREPLRETALLERMAEATSALTPNVHIREHYGLLLDVSASLTMFGGAQAVQARAQTLSQAQHVRCHAVLAPTASGARWLSRGHRQLVVESNVGAWLDDLALDCTDFSSALNDELHALNLHNLAAVRRLPINELNKRFGTTLTHQLACAYGESSETLPFWQPLTTFHDKVEFLDLAREQSHWMSGVEALLLQLQTFLRSRAASTQAIEFCFCMGSLQRTRFALQSAHGTHLASDWLRLFNARIDRLPITHEISSIDLSCERIEPMRFSDVDLFDRSREQEREWGTLTTLLRLRLGDNALHAPRSNANALPESQASQISQVAVSAPAKSSTRHVQAHASSVTRQDTSHRPIWLIHPPRPLTERELRALTSSIHLQQPERIQENWSHPEGHSSAQRDYYIAKTPDHRALWIFRERPRNDWFLQGVFA